jgi:hypothetical protein
VLAALIALPVGAAVAVAFRRLLRLRTPFDRKPPSARAVTWDRVQFSMMAGAVAGVALGMILTGAGPLAGLWLGGGAGVHVGALPPLDETTGGSGMLQNLLFAGVSLLGTAVGVVLGTF